MSAVLGLLTTRLIISNFGSAAYAQYGLLNSFPNLIAFADLGLAAAVLNSISGSDDPRRDPSVRRTLTTTFRVLMISGSVLVAAGALITIAGWWPTLLGAGLLDDSGLVPFACVAITGLTLPLTIGARVLLGMGRAATQNALQGLAPLLMLSLVTLVVIVGAQAGNWLSPLSYIANALAVLLTLAVAWRLAHPLLRRSICDIPRLRSAPNIKVFDVAWPMFIQMMALPIAMQTDRLLLSHLATADALAEYNLAFQLFALVSGTLAAGGIALWPVYARARSTGEIMSPLRPALAFGLVGALLAGLLALLSPLLADFVSSGVIVFDFWTLLGFSAFVVVQAVKYPLGMYMTDKRGLSFQVIPILVLVPLNLGISWWLIGSIGAAGPIVGSAVSVLVCQVIPNLVYISRDLRRRRRAADRVV